MPKGKYGKRETVFRKLIQRIKDSWNWKTNKFDSNDGKKAYNELCNMLIDPITEKISDLITNGYLLEDDANDLLQDFFTDLVKTALQYDPRQKRYYDLGFENFAQQNSHITQVWSEPIGYNTIPTSDWCSQMTGIKAISYENIQKIKDSYYNMMSTYISSVPIEDMKVIYNNDSYMVDFIGTKEEIQKRKKEYLKKQIFKIHPLDGLIIILYFGIDLDIKIQDSIYEYFAACCDHPFDIYDPKSRYILKDILDNLRFKYKYTHVGHPMSIDEIAELGNASNRVIARHLSKALHDLGMLVKIKEVKEIEAIK